MSEPEFPLCVPEPELLVEVRHSVGFITLNRPKALNTLNLPMVRALQATLNEWARSDAVQAVVVQGRGDKAFCAGGDVRTVHGYVTQNHPDYEVFFEEEYALNEYIYHYPKPYIAALNGIVMGGGMGISQGASHRLVNEYTRMAMPENAIGLFPDVGASYFLTRHSKALALYLGMVGKVLNAQDALFCHLADWSLPLAQWPIFFQGLETLAVANTSHRANESRGDLSAQIDKLLTDLKATQTGLPSFVADHIEDINTVFSQPSVSEIFSVLKQSATSTWGSEALQILQKNSPLAIQATWALLQRGHTLGLSDCFKLELELIKLWKHKGEFTEGVRAALIDKDKKPKWNFSLGELHTARLRAELPPLFG